MEKTNNKVKMCEKMSPTFEMVVRQRQGAALSTLLFNLCVDEVIRNEKTNPRGTVFNRTSQCLLFICR